MSKRINFILNGKRDISNVISNLKILFESNDKVLLYTKSSKEDVFNNLSSLLGISHEEIESTCFYEKFNEIDYEKIKKPNSIRIFAIKMPNSLFHTIPKAYNDAFKFVDETGIADYMHCFTDDCKIVSAEKYDPSYYEWFMDTFGERFVMDSKTNPGNYAFKKYSPRFVFISQKFLKSPISFVQFESKEHFIIDRKNLKENFDEKLKRMYINEYTIRLSKTGVIKHPTFFPDPIIETVVERDEKIPHETDIESIMNEYSQDDNYIKNVLKCSVKIENGVDPIIDELSKCISEKLSDSKTTGDA